MRGLICSTSGARPWELSVRTLTIIFAVLVGLAPSSVEAASARSLVADPGRLPQRRSSMDIQRNGSKPSVKGPAAYFTGTVRIDTPFQAQEPGRTGGAVVTFEAGARTHWHTHPLGQILLVTSGLGWTQCEDGPVTEIRPGDVIYCPPGHRHWHGATPTTAMTHVAIAEMLDGRAVDWMEPVTDAQYLAGEQQVVR
jgi:quercetin dioxygenase-like cupin family protein